MGDVVRVQGSRFDGQGFGRPPEEVLESHRRALAERDWPAVRRNYAHDAIVITDIGVTTGVNAIVAELQTIVASAGAATPVLRHQQIVTLDDRTHVARVLFAITTPRFDVPDGVDTYVIRDGVIVAQTAHGVPLFKEGPRG